MEVYKYFSRTYTGLDYSEDSIVECYEWETHGKIPTSNKKNGYIIGKGWMDVFVKMWKEDIEKGYLLRSEISEDPELSELRWWVDKVLPQSVRLRDPSFIIYLMRSFNKKK